MILRVGLTGGIGSGKSTVAGILERLGCEVLDSDRVVAALYEPGAAGWTAIQREYGEGVLDSSGRIDRAALSQQALATAEGGAQLNALIHPLVIEEQSRWLAELASRASDLIAVVEATLLLESGGRERSDRVIVVTASEELRVKRAVARGLPEAEVRRRIARQMRDEDRTAVADYIIANESSLEELEIWCRHVHRSLLHDLETKKTAPA